MERLVLDRGCWAKVISPQSLLSSVRNRVPAETVNHLHPCLSRTSFSECMNN